ncbi:MAG: hypothetical protein ACYC6T_09605 [Thermoleophilia bacterium]
MESRNLSDGLVVTLTALIYDVLSDDQGMQEMHEMQGVVPPLPIAGPRSAPRGREHPAAL